MTVDGRRTLPDPAPVTGASTPRGRAAELLVDVDGALDRLVDPLRGRPGVDTAARVVSNLADYGAVWVLLAVAKSLGGRRARRRSIAALAIAGISSYTVNAAVKRLVGRGRPEGAALAADGPLAVRAPTSSSFPSGHTLAAFCTATVLAESRAELGVFTGFAAAVAASRVHLRAHHGTDVVGGAAIGLVTGLVGRSLLARSDRRSRPGRECRVPARG